ncbi:MAG TPA: TolC family protein [Bryobacteraceae bacterium]|nr:TolC family protein [Bryobacteraceae bacterium]
MRIQFILCIMVPALAGAQPLASLVDEALRSNREILAAQKKYEAARQRPSQAGALPDPSISLGYTSNGGPWPVAGIGRAATSNVGLMVSQEMPFPGKRQLRTEIASKEADAEFQQYLAVRLDIASRLKQAYHELHHANAGAAFIVREQELLRNMLRIAEARYSVGRAAQQDIFKMQTQFSIFQAQLLRYQQERTAREIEINALLNRRQGRHIEVPMEMAIGELPATLEEMLSNARIHGPAVAREQKLVERDEAASNLARRDYLPDYTVSGGYFNQGSMPPMWQVRVDVKLPAWIWRKQHAAVTEQEFTTSQSRHNYEAVNVALEARIREDYAIAETARKLIDLYQKSAIPEAQLALESSMSGYETGKLDFLAVFSNFMNVVDYELMYHEEVMQFHVALARLEGNACFSLPDAERGPQ